MTLATDEFIRRFLMHVLPKGLHRIRHCGLFANGNRAANIARAASCSACRLARNLITLNNCRDPAVLRERQLHPSELTNPPAQAIVSSVP